MLQNFPADDLRARFDRYFAKLSAVFEYGRLSMLQEIAKAKKKPAEAGPVVQFRIVIGDADGNVDDDENVVREACNTVGLASSRVQAVGARADRLSRPASHSALLASNVGCPSGEEWPLA